MRELSFEEVAVAGLPLQRVQPTILRTIERFLASEGTKIVRAHCDLENPEAEPRAIREMAGAVTKKLLRFADGDVPFTHDIYLKRFEMEGRIEGYDYLLLDEAQDLNPVLISTRARPKSPSSWLATPTSRSTGSGKRSTPWTSSKPRNSRLPKAGASVRGLRH